MCCVYGCSDLEPLVENVSIGTRNHCAQYSSFKTCITRNLDLVCNSSLVAWHVIFLAAFEMRKNKLTANRNSHGRFWLNQSEDHARPWPCHGCLHVHRVALHCQHWWCPHPGCGCMRSGGGMRAKVTFQNTEMTSAFSIWNTGWMGAI